MSDKEGSLSRSASRSLSRDASLDSERRSSRRSDRSGSPLSLSRSRSRSRSVRRHISRSRSRSPSRKRYRSRSRSRSPYSRRRRRSRYSRSRSRSYGRSRSPGYRRGHSHSRSPMSNRRRHVGNRDAPKTSRCIGIFGLSLYTQERDLRDVFGRFGPIDEVQVVYDHQTGRSRGFAFLYYRNLEDAEEAKERAAGTEVDGRRIRVDYSITERAHTPTPGIYLGKPTSNRRSDYSRRSSSPGYSRRGSRYSRSRSRSRSYSPRRY